MIQRGGDRYGARSTRERSRAWERRDGWEELKEDWKTEDSPNKGSGGGREWGDSKIANRES